jgi:hypothetical protein
MWARQPEIVLQKAECFEYYYYCDWFMCCVVLMSWPLRRSVNIVIFDLLLCYIKYCCVTWAILV